MREVTLILIKKVIAKLSLLLCKNGTIEPEKHLVRKLNNYIDFILIEELVKDLYSIEEGLVYY